MQLFVITGAPGVPESAVKVVKTGSQELLMLSRLDALCDTALGVVPHTVVRDFHPGLSAVVMPRLQSIPFTKPICSWARPVRQTSRS